MRKGTIAFIVMVGVLGMAGFAMAGSSDLESFYDIYITKKINTCCKTASVFNKGLNPRMCELKNMRTEQAKFYQQNKGRLVKTMAERKVGQEPHKIDYFLITEFKNGNHKK